MSARVLVFGGDDGESRSLATAAPTADCAVVHVDARAGLLPETRRHLFVTAAFRVPHAVVAVTNLDEARGDDRFRELERACTSAARELGLERLAVIPAAALPRYLETIEPGDQGCDRLPFRLAVHHATGSDVAGTVLSGAVEAGMRVRVYPSARESSVEQVAGSARAHQAVTLTLAGDVAVARGDLVASADSPPQVADQFEATVVWLGDEPMLRGRTYLLRAGSRVVGATIAPLKYRVNVETLEHVAATRLEATEIGVCSLELSEPIAFDPYAENHGTGSFVLIDRPAGGNVGVGVLHFALRRAHNIHWQALELDKVARAATKRQRPCVIWLTGLSGAGKSTIANLVDRKLHERGCHTYVLDGDNVRHGLNKDLGFTDADRVENIRRVSEVARLMVDAGLIVIVAFISPFESERETARQLVETGEFFEVFVDAPLEVAEERDPKGLYRRARAGELANFTGIDSPYEPPGRPDLRIDSVALTPDEAAARVLDLLEQRGMI